ncbi:MAG: hypothetical protein EZS26_000286 [Candidatus Ordinivivax streblomastigis]|uniref:EpsG family protein n=1 Tax=Candidatus Ordinivivax streblomastigis TaxID=2540710 RepID=A0A5M8P5C3_9BACT|nr:MAG: hypothetical protein EZS26_000286 [Candidatus Ordinivivax streblomastigis]
MKDKYYLFFIPFFCINPFGTISLMLLITLLYPVNEEYNLKIFLFLLALFMGLIQSTRTIQMWQPSDWVAYMPFFLEAGNMPFLQYMQSDYKEPCFRLINYVGYYIFNGNFLLFATLLVVIMYVSVYMAIYKFWKANFQDVRLLITAVVLFTFMTENLAMINNILRQQFATGLMTYVIAQKVVDNKMNWWLAGFACLTHTFMFFFIPILFIKPLYRIIRLKSVLQIMVVILLFGVFLRFVPFVTNILSFSDTLSYGFERLGRMETERNTGYMIGNSVTYINLIFFLFVTLKLNYWNKQTNKNLLFFTNFQLFLSIACVLLSFAPMLQTRLYSTRNFIFPFILPLLFYKNPFIHRFYSAAVILFFYARFFFTFDSIGYGMFFPPIKQIITGSILSFL